MSGFREVDPETWTAQARSILERLDLTPEALILGKVSEDGEDILWGGCPSWFRKHPRTMPTIDVIVTDIINGPAESSDGAEGHD